MRKLLRRTWFVPPLAVVALTTWAFAALNHPAPMDWPPEPEVAVEAPPAPPPAPTKPRPRRSLLTYAKVPAPEPVEAPIDLVDVLAPDGTRAVAYVEVAALWRAPIGRAFEACLERKSKRERFEITRMADTVERIATDGRVIVLEGDLASEFHRELFFDEQQPEDYGDGAKLYGDRGAQVSDRLVIMRDRHGVDVRPAVDRAQGRRPSANEVMLPSERYGEVSMVVPPEKIGRGLRELSGIEPTSLDAIRRATVHIDAVDDVVLTVELSSSDAAALAELHRIAELAAGALRAGGAFMGSPVARVEDARVELRGERLTMEVRMTAEEAVRLIPECRRIRVEEISE